MARRTNAMEHLRRRLRSSSGQTGAYKNGATVLHSDVTFVATEYSRVVRVAEDSETTAGIHPWIVGTDEVTTEPTDGHIVEIGTRKYAVTRDENTDTYWQWHDTERKQRVIFTRLWNES